MNLDFDIVRQMFRKLGTNIDDDINSGAFDHDQAHKVPWLIHQPQSLEEIAENIFERLRGVGFEFTINYEDVDTDSIFLHKSINDEASM